MDDIIIIGGSFAGLAAALQLGRARRRVLVIDAGRPRNRFAQHAHGFLGHDGRPPQAILQDARDQLERYLTVRLLQGTVAEAATSADGVHVALSNGDSFSARRLILATGVLDQLPDLPGLHERWGEGVVHCPYCHGYEVADRRLGILALSKLALHQAHMLRDWSAHVTLFTNAAVDLSGAERAALDARGVRVIETPVAEVAGAGRSIEAVRLRDGTTVPIDALFVTPTIRLALPFVEQLGCAIEDGPLGPIISTDMFKTTTVPGVFAAGDAARPMHSISLAVADGAIAGVAAHRSLLGL
jgi:thioredoxin reductase